MAGVSRTVIRYQKALYEILNGLGATSGTREGLELILKSAVRTLSASAGSILFLDSTGKKLVHSVTYGLSDAYIKQGFLDMDKNSVMEEGVVVTVGDGASDPQLQPSQRAPQAGLSSLYTGIVSLPLTFRGEVVGTMRVYSRQRREFSPWEVDFLSGLTRLAAMVMERTPQVENPTSPTPGTGYGLATKIGRPVIFAHPSEEEFARLLDFYHVEWLYEPRSFPLQWDGERVTEMFTPDFYLPAIDLYVELTTMKQSLVTEKNRKLRRLKEQYPEVNIRLLYRRDYHNILAKFGYGPLGQAPARDVSQVLISSHQIQKRVRQLGEQISQDYAERSPVLVGILRGVFCFMADLMRAISLPLSVEFLAISYYGSDAQGGLRITKDLDSNLTNRDVILVEDIVDTGMTLNYLYNYLQAKHPANMAVCALLSKRARRLANVPLTYVGFEVPDEFLVGYGLDYHQEYRNLPFVAVLKAGEEKKPLVQRKRAKREKEGPE
ncbi:MAG: hypoxanthine phosphoribosyltransferase [Chloroflexi bacterium]|nr:hypoxanthine phosphoribosyltransferase [Chloroflexota bacterium]